MKYVKRSLLRCVI